VDAIAVGSAAAFASRSLAVPMGERTTDAVAGLAGIETDVARRWVAVGEAVAPTFAFSGDELPCERPAIAAAVASGDLGVADACVIVNALRLISPFADRTQILAAERLLVADAAGLTRRDVTRRPRRMIDTFDPDGTEPREDLLRRRSGIRVVQTPDGLVRWSVTMHPEAAGFLTAAVDARTAPRRAVRFAAAGEPEPDDADRRTVSVRRLDALVDIARESMTRDTGTVAGSPVTLVVTTTLDALLTGLGWAEVAGCDQSISAATVRRLAADAEIIPVVMGGPSEILDQGRAMRLFTTAQRRAMALRDGGCVWPGCHAPPGWCEAAHLLSWLEGGATDLDNGVLLCPFHHRTLDLEGWRFERDGGGVLWLIPPGHVDAWRTPRRAGRLPAVA
jgi:hypothetical protein